MPGPATRRYGTTLLVATLGLTAGLGLGLPALGWPGSWLFAATVVTFGAYGLDKAAARRGWLRVPEWILLAAVLLGGTLGALLAMPFFRHKTVKRAFRWKLWGVLAVQAALVVAWLLWGRAG